MRAPLFSQTALTRPPTSHTQQERLKAIKKTYGAKVLGTTTVEQCIGGMRGIPGLFWETSLLDAEEGIRFRGHSIPELQVCVCACVWVVSVLAACCATRSAERREWAPDRPQPPQPPHPRAHARQTPTRTRAPQKKATLPAAKEGGEPLPEGLLWLLMTGEVPTKAQAAAVTEELRARSKMPPHIMKARACGALCVRQACARDR